MISSLTERRFPFLLSNEAPVAANRHDLAPDKPLPKPCPWQARPIVASALSSRTVSAPEPDSGANQILYTPFEADDAVSGHPFRISDQAGGKRNLTSSTWWQCVANSAARASSCLSNVQLS